MRRPSVARFLRPIARLRETLSSDGASERESQIFQVLCGAGGLGYRLPKNDENIRFVSGRRDPRRRLARDLPRICRPREASSRREGWALAGSQLARRLADALTTGERRGYRRALYVLVTHATIGLAPDCVIPTNPLLRGAWRCAVETFALLHPSIVERVPPIEWMDDRLLTTLRAEVAADLRKARRQSARRAGMEGRLLTIDPRLVALASRAARRRLKADYRGSYLLYKNPGDHYWPHTDEPRNSQVTLEICIDRQLPPGRTSGSAFLAYRPDGSVERYELDPGDALVFDGRGLVHGREPLRSGERLVLLAIGLSSAATA